MNYLNTFEEFSFRIYYYLDNNAESRVRMFCLQPT